MIAESHKPFGPWIEEVAAYVGAEVSQPNERTWHLHTEYGIVRFSLCDHHALKFHRASVNHVDHKAGEQPACWTMARFEQQRPRSFLSQWYPRLVKFGEHRRSLEATIG